MPVISEAEFAEMRDDQIHLALGIGNGAVHALEEYPYTVGVLGCGAPTGQFDGAGDAGEVSFRQTF